MRTEAIFMKLFLSLLNPYDSFKSHLLRFNRNKHIFIFTTTTFIFPDWLLVFFFLAIICINAIKIWANIYLFKSNNRNTGTSCETCSKLILQTLEWHNVFHAFFYFFLLFLSMTLAAKCLLRWNTGSSWRHS